MSAPFPPPRTEGLRTLGPELTRIVDALARVQEEKDHRTARPGEVTRDRHLRPTEG
jgi:hypothetical protein